MYADNLRSKKQRNHCAAYNNFDKETNPNPNTPTPLPPPHP